MKAEWKAVPETAVVTFGGSYGANLAMWSRLKNPNVYAGAIASSVSVQKHLLRESNAFWMIVTEVRAVTHAALCGVLGVAVAVRVMIDTTHDMMVLVWLCCTHGMWLTTLSSMLRLI